VLAVVVGVRVLWVLLYNRAASLIAAARGAPRRGGIRQALIVSWCGMRGLVTLAIALALPTTFPARDLIVLTAFVVVLGTLVVQGLTLGLLIRLLGVRPDDSFERELSAAREALLESAVASLGGRRDGTARLVRADYVAERALTQEGDYPRAATDAADLRLRAIDAQRARLAELRRDDRIDDDVFRALEQELDWAELAASPAHRIEIVEG
jgi:CPA1 family monovalent cation:H+ antiporter